MHKLSSYPVIRTEHFSETVAFYEDTFGFVPFYEVEGYARLHHKDVPSAVLAVVRADHEVLPQSMRHPGNDKQILSLAMDNLDEAYDALYHEGLEIVKEPGNIGTVRHFMVADPNNPVVINIVSPVPCDTECQGEC